MRIDLYLKTSRLIKRRKLASEACSKGLVLINNKVVKPSAVVNLTDVITINFAAKQVVIKVTSLKLLKDDLMYELVSEKYHN